MEIKESIRAGLKELILTEIDKIREENTEIKTILNLTNKRLDDINLHLIDQSRRIDETNKRLDRLYEVIVRRDEHAQVVQRLEVLERDVAEMKGKMAA